VARPPSAASTTTFWRRQLANLASVWESTLKPQSFTSVLKSKKTVATLAAAPTSLMLVSSISTHPCLTGFGETQRLQSLVNRINYADVHGYRLFVSSVQLDARLAGPWNKLAVLQKAMTLHPGIEWFLFTDNDALILNPHQALNVSLYAGADHQHDFILQGRWEALNGTEQPDPYSFNTGVMLMRNSVWMRSFLAQWIATGFDYLPFNKPCINPFCEQMRALPKAVHGLYDQNGLALLLRNLSFSNEKKRVNLFSNYEFNSPDMYFERAQKKLYKHSSTTFSVVHFSGCQPCTHGITFNDTQCQVAWERAYEQSQLNLATAAMSMGENGW
jgi:hypothetical protein